MTDAEPGNPSRRSVLRGAGSALTLISLGALGCSRSGDQRTGSTSFAHGVASGDPGPERVILWTRVTTAGSTNSGAPVTVGWQVARDTRFERVVASGEAVAEPDRDHTINVVVTGLEPSSTYYYRFRAADRLSLTGRTKTLPAGPVDRARLGVVSCANFAAGHFTVYREVAARPDLDAVIVLGDFIYEHGSASYDVPEIGRPHDPPHDLETLADYRTRYAQYLSDPNTQAIVRQHPLIAIWDDHEFADQAWRGGARDVDGSEWARQREAAARAWHEWMPVPNDVDPFRIYRSFAFGDLIDLFALDTRIVGRDEPPGIGVRLGFDDDDRSLLGDDQRSWLTDGLTRSASAGTAWRVIAQQVPMVPLSPPFTLPDKWDGYAGERRHLFEHLSANAITNTVVLSGDVHTSWACDVPATTDDGNAGTGLRLPEFVCPSVTSPFLPDAVSDFTTDLVLRANPWVRWMDLDHRGWVELDVTRERVQADWYHVESVVDPVAPASFARAWTISRGGSTLTEASEPVAPRPDPPEPAP